MTKGSRGAPSQDASEWNNVVIVVLVFLETILPESQAAGTVEILRSTAPFCEHEVEGYSLLVMSTLLLHCLSMRYANNKVD
jgi:hypothetical protein